MAPTLFQTAQLQRALNDRAADCSETPNVPVLQCSRLLDQVGQDRPLLRELVGIFLEDAPTHLERIEQGIAAQNAREVRLEAHLLSGMAAQFGAWVVYRLAQRLERVGMSGDLSDAEILYSELEFALRQVRPLLAALPDSL